MQAVYDIASGVATEVESRLVDKNSLTQRHYSHKMQLRNQLF